MTAADTVRIPHRWYNVNAAFPELYDPAVDPSTGGPISAQGLEELFAPDLVAQEVDEDNIYLPIPEEVLRRYGAWRPTPLLRARSLEQALGTRCRILYKYEGTSPIGSHKANSGVAQSYFSKRGGRQRLYAETGAGQWGSAISMGAGFVGLQCDVFMVGNSFDSKPARRILMETFGSTVHRSPTTMTNAGKGERDRDPQSPGSLGLAIAEAIEAARADRRAAYALGSAFGFVCLHQTIIGQELKDQLRAMGVEPDLLVSCIGGGSSFAGLVFPFLDDVRSGSGPDLLAVESNAVPKVTRGRFAYDFGDTAGLTPLLKMYTLGHSFAPPSIHAGGLRYHGLAPQVSKLINMGLARGEAYSQLEIFEAAVLFARHEGLVPAPEAAHSIAAACAYAREHREEDRTIVFCLTGHGFFDLTAYERFNRGDMDDSDIPDTQISASLQALSSAAVPVTAEISHPAGAADDAPAANTAHAFDSWRARHFGAGRIVAPAGRPHESSHRGTRAAADLTQLCVVTERVIRAAGSVPAVLLSDRAVVTPAALGAARARRIAIVRARDEPRSAQ